MLRNPYDILGVPVGSSKDEIRKAYLNKIKQYHPDIHPNDKHAEMMTKEINEAYEFLNSNKAEQKHTSNLEIKRREAILKIENGYEYLDSLEKKNLINDILKATSESEISCIIVFKAKHKNEIKKKQLELEKRVILNKIKELKFIEHNIYIVKINSAKSINELEYIYKEAKEENKFNLNINIELAIKTLENFKFIPYDLKEKYRAKIIKQDDVKSIELIIEIVTKRNEIAAKFYSNDKKELNFINDLRVLSYLEFEKTLNEIKQCKSDEEKIDVLEYYLTVRLILKFQQFVNLEQIKTNSIILEIIENDFAKLKILRTSENPISEENKFDYYEKIFIKNKNITKDIYKIIKNYNDYNY